MGGITIPVPLCLLNTRLRLILTRTKRAQQSKRNIKLVNHPSRLVSQANFAVKLTGECTQQPRSETLPGWLHDHWASAFGPRQRKDLG
jgi:hypothetical protein